VIGFRGLHGGVRSLEESTISKKVFVGNLNYQTTKEQLSEMLGTVGEITDVHLPLDRATGRPRGFAFVEYATEEESAKAIAELDGKDLGGRPLRINEAQERAPRAPGFRPSFDGGGGGGGGGSFGGGPSFGGGGGGGGGGGRGGGRDAPSRPKGSRRGMRRKKRSL